MAKAILFGVGSYLQKNIEKLYALQDLDILFAVDNKAGQLSGEAFGLSVYQPKQIRDVDYDYIVITSTFVNEIRLELIGMKVDECKIYSLDELMIVYSGERQQVFLPEEKKECNDAVLMITTRMNFDGGTLAGIYALSAYQKQGYRTRIITPRASEDITKYVLELGIELVIDPIIETHKFSGYEWFVEFGHIIINTYQAMFYTLKCSLSKKTIWWLHESESIYKEFEKKYGFIPWEKMENIQAFAVSNLARDNFKIYYPDKKCDLLTLGIPDFASSTTMVKNDKFIFAFVGGFHKIKGCDILLDAIEQLTDDCLSKCEFWIIGRAPNNSFTNAQMERISKLPTVKYLGSMTHKEIEDIYPQFDAIICSSRSETLCISIIEGMMNRKICIYPDGIGVSDFMVPGKDGMSFKLGDSKDLARCIETVVSNEEDFDQMRDSARNTYEKFFSMEAFEARVEKL